MATQVNDSTFDPSQQALIRRVFREKGIVADPTDYTIIEVEPVLDEDKWVEGNTLMHLSPVVTSAHLPNLDIYYNRTSLVDAFSSLSPWIMGYTTDNSLDEVLEDILTSINNQIPLTMEDFYNTFVAEDTDTNSKFIELHSMPSSFYYTGKYRVPVVTEGPAYTLLFEAELVPKV